jgi:uroporphyrinogen III methyltransferase / synthase
MKGCVQLVGAGPGDPGLLTLKAKECLQQADVVVYDHLANKSLLQHCRADATHIFVGKEAGRHTLPQAEIGACLVEHAQAGKRVVRLKGGDPFVFGRGGEEIQSLRNAEIPFEIVPGVTAALAAAAYTGIPLSQRGHSSAITFLTGHEDPNKQTLTVNFAAHARTGATLCIYMGMGQLPRITQELLAGGLPATTPAAVVQWATLPRQQSLVSTLGNLVAAVEASALSAPAVIIVGEVVNLREQVSWFESLPLFGKRIVVTRAREQSGSLASQLASLGAEVLELPFIAINKVLDPTLISETMAHIAQFEWLVFTSANGVDAFFELLMKAYGDIRCLGPARIAVVGKATAKALARYHLKADLVPETQNGDALADAMIETGSMESTRVLVITGNRNRPDLVQTLEHKGGAIVDTLPLYETTHTAWQTTPEGQKLLEVGADAILFTSSSTVESFVHGLRSQAWSANACLPKFGSIGPLTNQTLRENNLPVDFEAEKASVKSLIKACLLN